MGLTEIAQYLYSYSMRDYAQDLQRAFRLADAADVISMPYYKQLDLAVTSKADSTPVSEADKVVEKTLSDIVINEFKESYVGEEGVRNQQSKRRWVVDPIDGTKNFIRHVPVWATLISLSDNDEVIVAVVSAPAMGRRWWATKGGGAWTQDVDGTKRRLAVSGTDKLDEAAVTCGSLFYWEDNGVGLNRILQLLRDTYRHRSFGDFWAPILVAEGAFDISVDAVNKYWDVEAVSLVVREAGGKVWMNAGPDTPFDQSRINLSTNGRLEATVLKALNL